MENSNAVSAAGTLVSKIYNESGFTSIFNKIDGNIAFTQASAFSIVVTAEQFILDILSIQVVNNQLIITYLGIVPTHLPVNITISAPVLNGITIGSSGNFNSSNAINGSNLNIVQSSSGTTTLSSFTGTGIEAKISSRGGIIINSGSVQTENIIITSSGSMILSGLTAVQSTVKISGSGDTKVNVSQTLGVTISGSGSVYYSGNAKVSSKISGSGKVIHV